MSTAPSSTQVVPEARQIPRHVAIIMDGNGRWAKQRFLPRIAGHKRGVEAVRSVVRTCADIGVDYLTLFAFSSENWRRPLEEVKFLMQLFVHALENEVAKLHKNDIRFRVIGDLSRFDASIVRLIREAEEKTLGNKSLILTIAANYGGRWDMLQAVNRMIRDNPSKTDDYVEQDLTPYFAMRDAPEPDLFIRTGGEKRISNFLLWQLAYTELYFTDLLWPDFDATAMGAAIGSYQQRERRYGRTSEQLQENAMPQHLVSGA
ncbi:MAG: isoprenyl transferase [Burkholderiales bacterium]